MDLARRMVVPEEASGEDRHEVFHVVDVSHRDGRAVDEVGERLVPDAREAVSDEGDLRGGDVQGEEDGVEERDRAAEGVAREPDVGVGI